MINRRGNSFREEGWEVGYNQGSWDQRREVTNPTSLMLLSVTMSYINSSDPLAFNTSILICKIWLNLFILFPFTHQLNMFINHTS